MEILPNAGSGRRNGFLSIEQVIEFTFIEVNLIALPTKSNSKVANDDVE
jgi:hypothetical protein